MGSKLQKFTMIANLANAWRPLWQLVATANRGAVASKHSETRMETNLPPSYFQSFQSLGLDKKKDDTLCSSTPISLHRWREWGKAEGHHQDLHKFMHRSSGPSVCSDKRTEDAS